MKSDIGGKYLNSLLTLISALISRLTLILALDPLKIQSLYDPWRINSKTPIFLSVYFSLDLVEHLKLDMLLNIS